MDFLPLDFSLDPTSRFFSVATPFIFTLLGVGLIAGLVLIFKYKNNFGWFMVVSGLIAGAILTATTVAGPATNSISAVSARFHQAPEIQKTIESTYGLKPTVSEVRSLDYPPVKPTKDFEVFGSFKDRKQVEGTQFEQRTIYLVWADGKFGLSQSSDGESFTPLKARG